MKVSRSLRQTLRKNLYEVRFNTAFVDVITGCADREETWISPEIIRVYTELHQMGYVHSVESWHQGKLVGGLYGVVIGGVFFVGAQLVSRGEFQMLLAYGLQRQCQFP